MFCICTRRRVPPDGEVTCSGFLDKRGPTKWHRYLTRFFELRGRWLVYYKDADEAAENTCIGSIDLCAAQISGNSDGEFGFYILGNYLNRDYCLQAPSLEKKNMWCDQLMMAISQHTNSNNVRQVLCKSGNKSGAHPAPHIPHRVGDTTCSGLLLKTGMITGRVKQGYYDLRKNILFYSPSVRMSKFKFLNVTDVEVESAENGFTICGPKLKRKYKFICSDNTESTKWISSLRQCSKYQNDDEASTIVSDVPPPLPIFVTNAASDCSSTVSVSYSSDLGADDFTEILDLISHITSLSVSLPRTTAAHSMAHLSRLDHTSTTLEALMNRIGWCTDGEQCLKQGRVRAKVWRKEVEMELASQAGTQLISQLREHITNKDLCGGSKVAILLRKWLSGFIQNFDEVESSETTQQNAKSILSEFDNEASLEEAKLSYSKLCVSRDMKKSRNTIEVELQVVVLSKATGKMTSSELRSTSAWQKVVKWLLEFENEFGTCGEEIASEVKSILGIDKNENISLRAERVKNSLLTGTPSRDVEREVDRLRHWQQQKTSTSHNPVIVQDAIALYESLNTGGPSL